MSTPRMSFYCAITGPILVMAIILGTKADAEAVLLWAAMSVSTAFGAWFVADDWHRASPSRASEARKEGKA